MESSDESDHYECSDTHPSESGTEHTEDFYIKFKDLKGWQSLILLQFDIHTSIAVALESLYVFDLLYLADLIAMVVYKNLYWGKSNLQYQPRHTIILLVEVISLIPWEQAYDIIVGNALSYIFYTLRLRYVLRLCRFYCFFKDIREYVDEYSHLLHLIVYVLFLLLLVVTFGSISYLYDCKFVNETCNRDVNLMGKHMYLSSATFFMRGAKEPVRNTIMDNVFFSLVPYIMNTYFVSFFTIDVLETIRMRFEHMTLFEWVGLRIEDWQQRYKKDWNSFHVKYVALVKEFSYHMWNKTKGQHRTLYLGRVLPPIMYKELYLDVSWAALKHSHLFRHEEVFFLRAVASVMDYQTLCPGEIVYSRNKFKSSMVYITSGVADILSEEDGETPVVSLTSGTCLGESSLVLMCPSSCTVVAKNTCDIVILHRRKFFQLSEQYPKEVLRIRKMVYKRIKVAKGYRRLSLYQQQMQNLSERIGVITMRWLQLTLRKLLSYSTRIGDLHDKHYLLQLEENIFCSKYLDLLVTAQDIYMVNDSVFIKNTFPFIFKPNSILLKTWNLGVIVMAIVLSIAFPYCVIFSDTISTEYSVLCTVATLMWTTDLYLKSSTMVQNKQVLYTKVTDIIMYNFRSIFYVLDFLCIIPTEVLVYYTIDSPNKQAAILTYMNRLLKFYRIELLLRNIKLRLWVHIVLQYIKFSIYLTLIAYYIGGILYVFALNEDNLAAFQRYLNIFLAEAKYDIVFLCLSSAVNFLGNMHIIPFPYLGDYHACTAVVVLQVGTFVFLMYFIAYSAAAHTLMHANSDKIMSFLRDTRITMNCFNINKELEERVWRYIRMQIQTNDMYFLTGGDLLHFLPHDLFVMTFGIAIGDLIRNQQLFFELSDELLSQVCSVATVHILPAMEVIKHAGEICTELHILTQGQCSVMCINGESKTVYPGECFSIVECSLNIVSMVTVRAMTNCKIVSFSFNKFKALLLQYPQDYRDFEDAVRYFNILEIYNLIKDNHVDHNIHMAMPKIMHIRSFGYSMKKRTKRYFMFHDGFPRWAFPLKYILLRYTFYCNGKFVLYWEVARCIFALTTSFVFPLTVLYTSRISLLKLVITMLDLTAYADVYMRHHFSYYKIDGVEVTHPYKTAKFYWQHGLAVDLLGCLPIYTMAHAIFSIKYDMLLFMNRPIQLYRVQGLKKYFFRRKIRVESSFALLTYIPFLIIVCNIIASGVFAATCNIDHRNRADCVFNTWIQKISRNSSRYEVYCNVLLFTISGIVFNSFGIISVETVEELSWFLFAVLSGLILQAYIIALVVSTSFSINRDLISYQEAMQMLVKFLSYRKIDKNIKTETVNHFEYMWYKTKGKSIQTAFSPFKTSFKMEALYNIYGSIFEQSTIFPEPNQSFFKSLLLDIKHETYLKTGILYSVNDVNEYIFFLFKGKVEVVGADLNRLLTLRIGSVFGNLGKSARGRMTLSMVASGHVEVLKISNVAFYHHLYKFPVIEEHFATLTVFNVDYLQEEKRKLEVKRTVFGDEPESRSKLKSLMREKKRKNVFVKNKIIQFWEDVILNIVHISSYVFELYYISTCDESYALTFFLYTFDVLYILKIYLKFHTTFENEFGQVIYDRKQIAKNYMKNILGFYFDVSTIIPFELVSLFFLNSPNFRQIWAGCRINRLPRVIPLFIYLMNHSEMLNISVFTIKTVFLLVKVILAQVTLGAILELTRPKPVENSKRFGQFFDSLTMIINSCAKFSFDLSTFQRSEWMAILAITLVFTCKYITWYFIAQTCSLLYVVNFTRFNYAQFTIFMNRYMDNESVSAPLANQITVFTKFLWGKTHGNLFPILLEETPYYLKEAILNSMFGYHLLQHPLLRHCHKDLMRQMTSHMKTTSFHPGNTVVYAGDIDNTMYFIHEGEIKALSEDTMYSEEVELVLYDGDMFGLEQGLYERRGHEYTYRAVNFCVLIMLKRDDWIYLLDFFPASKRVVYDRSEDP